MIRRALKTEAINVSRLIPDLVNEAIRNSLAEDFDDVDAYESRLNEASFDFENVLKEFRSSGKI